MRSRRSLLRSLLLALPASFLGCTDDNLLDPLTATLEVAVSTGGSHPDFDGYSVQIDSRPARTLLLGESFRATDLEPGDHTILLTGIAPNCIVLGDNPLAVVLTAGQTARVSFELTCSGPGSPETPGVLRVTTNILGYYHQFGFDACCSFSLDGKPPSARSVWPYGDIFIASITPGAHIIRVSGVPDACPVEGSESHGVTVPAGDTAHVTFTIRCVETLGSIKVSVTSSGSPLDPDGYLIGLPPIRIDSSLVLDDILVGPWSVTLEGVNTNCEVTGGATQTVTVTPRDTVPMTFAVVCSSEGFARWTALTSGSHNHLRDVWGTSSTDVFAAGYGDSPCGSCGAPSIMLHHDGTAWTKQFTGVAFSHFDAVWVGSPTRGFAVGAEPGSSAVVYHYNGSQWGESTRYRATAPDWQNTSVFLWGVWGDPSGEAFVVGGTYSEYETRALIGHYNGVTWLWSEIPDGQLTGVWGSSSRNVYAVGSQGRKGVVLHFDGSKWTTVLETAVYGSSVWGSGPNDVYVAQWSEPLLHFDGLAWQSVERPAGSIHDLHGSSSTNVYAVGDSGLVLHFDGKDWTRQTGAPNTSLHGVWASPAGDVYAVGANGMILHHRP